jgi:DNA-directed RNA polymerase subunit K/omega
MAETGIFLDEPDENIAEDVQEEEYLDMGIVDVSADQKLDDTPFFDIKNAAKNKIPDDKRTTRRFMTKYERAKIIGVRSQQIALGAVPNIELPKGHHMTPREIARLELNQKKTPIIIHRIFHTGMYEAWKVEELI